MISEFSSADYLFNIFVKIRKIRFLFGNGRWYSLRIKSVSRIVYGRNVGVHEMEEGVYDPGMIMSRRVEV